MPPRVSAPRLRLLLFVLAGAAIPLAAASATGSPVAVGDAWFRYITPQTPAGGYMQLHNRSAQDAALVSASSPGCGTLMLHESQTRNGADAMTEVRRVAIPAGKSVAFAPGGYHLMCMSPHMKPGERIPVTLHFAGGQRLTVPFAVYGAAGKPGAE